MIYGFVDGQNFRLSQSVIASDSKDYLTAQFEFSEDWDKALKVVHFINGEKKWHIELEDNKITQDKHLNLTEGEWCVCVVGAYENTTITTISAKLVVKPTCAQAEEPFPVEPPSLGQQILQTANDAKETADKALEEAQKTEPFAIRAEEAAKKAEQHETTSSTFADSAKQSADNAKVSEQNADESEAGAKQAFGDLLNMIGKDIPTLVDGKVPVEQLPATALVDIFEVSSEQELTGLNAQKGDLGELIELIDGKRTITKTWQLLTNDPTSLDNWVIWGSSYAVQAGNATTADNAENANTINNHRLVFMNKEQFDPAVKDPSTLYLVYYPKAEV